MPNPESLPDRVAEENAPLRVISLQQLIDGDEVCREHLLKACTDLGFFYLDCREVASGQVMANVQSMYDLAISFYDLPQDEKMAWLVDRDHDEHLVMGSVRSSTSALLFSI